MQKGTYDKLRDEEIIQQILVENRTELFEILYDRYLPRVIDKCYSLLKDRSLSQEFAADILSKAFEKLPGFRAASTFSSWLYTITYNYCIDYLRNKKKLHYPEWNNSREIPEIVDEVPMEEVELDYDRMMKILDMIHQEEKALLLMKYQDNISIKEISRALRITESAAKMRLKRARARVLYLYKKMYGIKAK